MGYIGNQTSNSYSSMDKQTITGNGGTSYTLTHAVANAQEIEVFVNNVRQEAGVAYTVSGTALTMTGNVASTDDFYVIYQGKALQTVVPPDGSVGTGKIVNGAVTDAKINTMAASKLTGALPAIDGSSLTGLTSGFTFPSAQTLNGVSSRTFTGIPSGTNIIKYGVWRHSGSAQATFQLMLGDSGGIETSGYSRGDQYANTGGGTMQGSSNANDSAWTLGSWTGAANVIMHQGEIFRVDGNKWLLNANAIYVQGPNYFLHYHGYKELSGELTQIKFQLSTGTFDDSDSYIRIGYA